jgi:outer membrane protein assembly factor BamD (BamD/ComL family)
MLKDKKKIIYVIISIILVGALIFGTAFTIKTISDTTKTPVVTAKQKADSIKTQAIAALKAKDTAKAITLFKQANQQYTAINDGTNEVDTNAQLCLLGQKAYCPNAAK